MTKRVIPVALGRLCSRLLWRCHVVIVLGDSSLSRFELGLLPHLALTWCAKVRILRILFLQTRQRSVISRLSSWVCTSTTDLWNGVYIFVYHVLWVLKMQRVRH